MHLLEIGLLIFILIFIVIVKHWIDKVERGIVSLKKYNVVLFNFSIAIVIYLLLSHLHFETNPIPLICYGVLTGLILVSIVDLKTNDSEECQEDLRIWSGYIVLLTFGTGALSLMIHDPDSIKEASYLVGLIAVIFYQMFVRPPR